MADDLPHAGTGLVVGKFMPPHLGHQHLIDFARRYVEQVTVLVCSIKSQPIPGELRYQWTKAMFPDCRVFHVTGENVHELSGRPALWEILRSTIRRVLPTGPDFVFASEAYGHPFARKLGARFIPVDLERARVPISASAIRENPIKHWEFIPPVVRPYYVKRVCIVGPEATGKTTLAGALARHYQTVAVEGHARALLDCKSGRCDPEDLALMARGQMAAEDALALEANRVMFCDSDLLTTAIWSETLLGIGVGIGIGNGGWPDWVKVEAERRRCDLYLLLDVDDPRVGGAQRHLPHRRDEFLDRCCRELEARKRPYAVIRGGWKERFAGACAAVERVLGNAGRIVDC